MKINGKVITKSGFITDGSRFAICNEEDIPENFLNEFVKFYPIDKLPKIYTESKDPFRLIYDFIEYRTTYVGQGEKAIFE